MTAVNNIPNEATEQELANLRRRGNKAVFLFPTLRYVGSERQKAFEFKDKIYHDAELHLSGS